MMCRCQQKIQDVVAEMAYNTIYCGFLHILMGQFHVETTGALFDYNRVATKLK